MDLGFVVDSSGSLGAYDDDGEIIPGNYDTEKSFIKEIANNVGLSASGVHASVVQFGTTANLEIEFLDDVTKFTSRVDAMEWMQSSTRIDLGLDVAYNEMFQTSNGMRESEDCSKIVVVMTDGVNDEPLSQLDPAKQFHDDGIKVVVIGVGGHINETELLTLVKSDDSYHTAQDFGVFMTDSFMNGIVNCEKLSGKYGYVYFQHP